MKFLTLKNALADTQTSVGDHVCTGAANWARNGLYAPSQTARRRAAQYLKNAY